MRKPKDRFNACSFFLCIWWVSFLIPNKGTFVHFRPVLPLLSLRDYFSENIL